MVKRFEREPDEKLGTKKLNGRTLHGFRHRPNEYNDFTIWVDSETKLPVEIELNHPTVGQTIFMDQFEFDFELDESARAFLKSLAEAKPESLDAASPGEERFTRMIVMPDGTIMGLAVNGEMSEQKLQELVDSLTEIKSEAGEGAQTLK